MIQLDLFDDLEMEPVDGGQALPDRSLNGFYYERSSDKFASFALGSRHFEVSAKECEFPKEWQKRIKQERAI
ncbi:hypothetical protein P4V54_09185 [Brevibacillus nitrificans]|uniref:hypothetical protein n=1 Tax=Brevibacillus nitrificans TaxID=651560 RepID=UPI002E1E7E32|nr:hypothetical protein [Brevibacillus nitrificans]